MRLNESIIKNLNIVNEAVYGKVAPDFNAEDGFDSMSTTDAMEVFDDLVKFYTDFAEAVRQDTWAYQGADSKKLDRVASLLQEARQVYQEMCDEV